MTHEHKPVEINLVHLWVIGFNFLLSVIDEIGEIGQRGLHWVHLGEAVDLCANLIQHAFYSYRQHEAKKTHKQIMKSSRLFN